MSGPRERKRLCCALAARRQSSSTMTNAPPFEQVSTGAATLNTDPIIWPAAGSVNTRLSLFGSRLVDQWVSLIGLNPADYGTHSLQRTKVSILYKRTGNLRARQLLLGHTKLESTVRYLGIEVDDALSLSEQTEF